MTPAWVDGRPPPWRLRLRHEGDLAIRLERRGRSIVFDPTVAAGVDAISVITGAWPEQIEGVRQAAAGPDRPTVVADPAILQWLERKGVIDGHRSPVTLDGVVIDITSYKPIPYATPAEGVRKARSALLRPDRAVTRLVGNALLRPTAPPGTVGLTFPDGSRLAYLGLSLHDNTPDDWLDAAIGRHGGVDWLLLGVDYGEDDGVMERVGRFGAGKVLVADLLGGVRRRLGMPVRPVTLLVDRLRTAGVDAYVLASHSSLRFE